MKQLQMKNYVEELLLLEKGFVVLQEVERRKKGSPLHPGKAFFSVGETCE